MQQQNMQIYGQPQYVNVQPAAVIVRVELQRGAIGVELQTFH
jgi:hypothetical protein